LLWEKQAEEIAMRTTIVVDSFFIGNCFLLTLNMLPGEISNYIHTVFARQHWPAICPATSFSVLIWKDFYFCG
jgi:hypothetical protein